MFKNDPNLAFWNNVAFAEKAMKTMINLYKQSADLPEVSKGKTFEEIIKVCSFFYTWSGRPGAS